MTTPPKDHAYTDAALRVCQALVDEQRFYEVNAHELRRMPGNEFYSDRFMRVVRMAEEVLLDAAGKTEGKT